VYAVILILVGNAKTVWLDPGPGGSGVTLLLGLGVAIGSVAYGRYGAHLTWSEIGLAPGRAVTPSLAVGAAVVLGCLTVAAFVGHLAAALGVTLPVPVAPPGLASLETATLWRRILVLLPLDTAVPEELAFRGVLLGLLLQRHLGWPTALALVTLASVLWHGALGWSEVGDDPQELALRLSAYTVGGLLFAVPRLSTRHLAGSILSHWAVDGLLFLAASAIGLGLRGVVVPGYR
jgi:tRNA pseudouridine32 synthase/23S rRNA pseudouridine746 synthase